MILLAVQLVLHAALSFRGAAAALTLFAESTRDGQFLPGSTPCATTIRSWVLRLGYASLTRQLPHGHRWAWLIDHTLQIGPQRASSSSSAYRLTRCRSACVLCS